MQNNLSTSDPAQVGEMLDGLAHRTVKNLNEFRASRIMVPDLAVITQGKEDAGRTGYVYPGHCFIYIESDSVISDYLLVIDSEFYQSTDLHSLEITLYEQWFVAQQH